MGGNKSNNVDKQMWTGGNKSNNAQPQPLCQWSEVPNHPGLVCSVMQSSNNPVILMIKPDTILVQEIKVVPAKAKIMDMVAIRHPSSNADHRTTLILLCEDGSLRIYMASMEQTGFWLSSSVQPCFECLECIWSVIRHGKSVLCVRIRTPRPRRSGRSIFKC